MIFSVPDLSAESAMRFCKEIDSYQVRQEGEVFEVDFEHVINADPFPMLMIASAIRRKKAECSDNLFIPKNCNNGYAKYMKFYSACGFDIGDSIDCSRETSRYSCITRFSMSDLYRESHNHLDYIQETLEKKAKGMSKVLSQGNVEFEKWMTYVIRELLRNIPEHSNATDFWYCAQYWPTHDLVELSILDEGIGIRRSLADSAEFMPLFHDDYEAIQLALEPGVSGTFSSSRQSIGQGDWVNSGYGLYMVSQMCAELGASFIISSGDSAIEVVKQGTDIRQIRHSSSIQGTAIQIRIKPSKNVNYERVRSEILKRGEEIARKKDYTIHSASKSSRGLL